MNCLNFGSLILASLYNMGWVDVVWMALPLIYGFHVTEHLSEPADQKRVLYWSDQIRVDGNVIGTKSNRRTMIPKAGLYL